MLSPVAAAKFSRSIRTKNQEGEPGSPTMRRVGAETTPLWRCLQEEDPVAVLAGVEELVQDRSNDVNMRDEIFGWTPLLFAANLGITPLFKLLLDARAKVQAVDNEGNTALILAARRGHIEVVAFLIGKKVELDAQNNNGWTALIWAAIWGHGEVTTTLVDAAADINLTDGEGRTACMWAARHGHAGIVKVLLACGINLGLRDQAGLTAMDHAEEHMELRTVITAAEEVNSRLLDAAKRADVNGVAGAIKDCANLDCRDGEGWTPLLWSAMHSAQSGSLDLVAMLVRHGAKPELLTDSGELFESLGAQHLAVEDALQNILGSNGRMLRAAENADWEQVEEELDIGSWVNVKDANKRTALMWAARAGSPEAVTMLVEKGANLEDRDDFGWTAVHFAVFSQSVETVSTLFFHGAAFVARTYDGDTALHAAVRGDDGAMVQLLLVAKADVEEKDLEDRTPLQIAVVAGLPNSVHTCLACGADFNVLDRQKRSAFALAVVNGHHEVVEIMLRPLKSPPKLTEEGEDENQEVEGRRTRRAKTGKKLDKTPDESMKESPSKGAVKRSHAQGDTLSTPTSPKTPSLRRAPSKTPKSPVSPSNKGGLLTKKPGPDKKAKTSSTDGHNSLLEMAIQRRLEIIKSLPTLGKSILSSKDRNGRSPLQLAVHFQQEALVPALVGERADPSACDENGNTVLMEACITNQVEVVGFLLSQKVKLDVKNADGKIALDMTEDQGIRQMLKAHVINSRLPAESHKKEDQEHPKMPVPGRRSSKVRAVFRVRIESLPLQLTGDILEENVRSLLRRLGAANPARVEVALDPITSRPRGYAYVDFVDAAACDLAMRGDGQEMSGSVIRVFRENDARRPARRAV